MDLLYSQLKNELLTGGSSDCQKFFEQGGYILELAYYNLFHKNISKSISLFSSVGEQDIRARWGEFFALLCSGKVKVCPTYMELRNFYEIDLNLLFVYYLGDYIEVVCRYLEWLATINPEIYKYTGRVFMNNNIKDFGLYFLEKGVSAFYNDPELHYMLAEYYMSISNEEKTLKYLNSCLEILPEYYPAERMLKELDG